MRLIDIIAILQRLHGVPYLIAHSLASQALQDLGLSEPLTARQVAQAYLKALNALPDVYRSRAVREMLPRSARD